MLQPQVVATQGLLPICSSPCYAIAKWDILWKQLGFNGTKREQVDIK